MKNSPRDRLNSHKVTGRSKFWWAQKGGEIVEPKEKNGVIAWVGSRTRILCSDADGKETKREKQTC